MVESVMPFFYRLPFFSEELFILTVMKNSPQKGHEISVAPDGR
jgi:hypothetical protein